MTETKNVDEFDPQPGFHLFGGEDSNKKDYIDPAPIKWITGKEYMFDMPRDFKEHAQIKRWCEENCKDAVAYEIKRGYSMGTYFTDKIYFFLETDAAAFKLRWL